MGHGAAHGNHMAVLSRPKELKTGQAAECACRDPGGGASGVAELAHLMTPANAAPSPNDLRVCDERIRCDRRTSHR